MDSLEDIRVLADNARETLLPSKSKTLYENTYMAYRDWCTANKIPKTTEDSILAYFKSKLDCFKSSTLWTKYSMLRTTINLHEGVDVSKFPSVIPYLKRKAEGHKAKKSFTLSKENVDQFLLQAEDKEHLLNKVVCYKYFSYKLFYSAILFRSFLYLAFQERADAKNWFR